MIAISDLAVFIAARQSSLWFDSGNKMKRFELKLVAFFLVTLVAMSGNGCTGSSAGSNNTTAKSDGPVKNESTGKAGDSSRYPPMPAGIAEADITFMDGTKAKIADRKGKVLMLNLWGTWCGPCRAEMPHLVELHQKYGEKGFEVIGLNIGDGSGEPEPDDLINRFTAQMKLNYPIAKMDNKYTTEFYKFTGRPVVPTTLLVDAEGRIRGVFIGGGQNVFDKMKSSVAELMEG